MFYVRYDFVCIILVFGEVVLSYLNDNFYKTVERLKVTGMGTEHVAVFLYSLIRMLRPKNVLEVGLGYTSPFMAQALKHNIEEVNGDKQILEGNIEDEERKFLLNNNFFRDEYKPRLIAIDDYSIEGTSAPKVLEALEILGLDSLVEVCVSDFRGYSKQINKSFLPLDLVWFDCGGKHEYIDFLHEYWDLINPNHGHLLLHYTYWDAETLKKNPGQKEIVLSCIANEIKRQQLKAGVMSEFEVLSLLEPHKTRQGSVTMIRRLPWNSRCRDVNFQKEIKQVTGEECRQMRKL